MDTKIGDKVKIIKSEIPSAPIGKILKIKNNTEAYDTETYEATTESGKSWRVVFDEKDFYKTHILVEKIEVSVNVNLREEFEPKDRAETFKKFDNGKVDYSLLEPLVVEMYCTVAQMGANKYGRNNWKQSKKEDMYRYEAALLRHFMAYKSGEKKDSESGFSHLAHALWNLVALETKERE